MINMNALLKEDRESHEEAADFIVRPLVSDTRM